MTTIARHQQPVPDPTIRLLPASQYTIEELTNAYNQTRVDYMVPMPMNAARLAAYIKTYDVDMERSWVAIDDNEILGLAMLGVRPGRTWVTRLGVLPVRRRRGTGEALTLALLEGTRQLGRPLSILEVIKGNFPAHQLFLKVSMRHASCLYCVAHPACLHSPTPVKQLGLKMKRRLTGCVLFRSAQPGRTSWSRISTPGIPRASKLI
jgi:hypothetical protein